MPTGYTVVLDENPELTTAKWVTEELSRNFGVCFVLRDGPHDLTEEAIEAYLKNEIGRSTSYHKEKISEAQETLKAIKVNPEVWNDLYASTVDELKKCNQRSIKEAKSTKQRHQQVEQDLIKLRDRAKDELTRNIAKFGLNQLEVAKSETEPYIQEIPHLDKFKTDKLASLNLDIEYHTENMEKTEKRERERLLVYQKIRQEVNEILGCHTSEKKEVQS